MANRVGGIINFKVDGALFKAKGSFTYNIGRPVRESVIGADTVHGFLERPQVAFIEGAITDDQTLNLKSLVEVNGATVTLELANGKVVVLRDAYFAGEGSGTSEEGEIAVRFESAFGEEVV